MTERGSSATDSLGKNVAARFSAAADQYDAGASIQKTIVTHLSPLLTELVPPGHVLELGCGSGQLTRLLCATFPSCRIDAVDISPRMVDVARSELPGQVTLHLEDARTFKGSEAYDLIVSSSALHWMTPLSETMHHLAQQLTPSGTMVFAIMLEGTLEELRSSRLRVAPLKPPRGRLPHKEEVIAALRSAHLDMAFAEEHTLIESHLSAKTFLRHIHEQGLTGGAVSRSSALLNRSELRGLEQDYESRHSDETGCVTATYRTLVAKARRIAR